MKRTTLFRLASRSLFCIAPAATVMTGCGTQPAVDRAAYDAPPREAEPTRSATLEGRVRAVQPTGRGIAANFDGPATAATRQAAEPQRLDAPIPTPVPDRVRATYEAEPALPSRVADPVAAAPVTTAGAAAPSDGASSLRQAEEHNARGTEAAAKGVWFTARTEFAEALRLTAVAGDARRGGGERAAALFNALTALEEAEEFTAVRADRPLDVESVRRRHRTTPLLPATTRGLAPAALHDAYLAFAKEQLTTAASGGAVGSVALHGLGKVHAAAGTSIDDSRAKAHAYYAAALAVAPANFLAANDLAVLLADDGRLEQARDVLHAGLRQSSQPAMWKNLAAVHDRLGETELAQRARLEAVAVERRALAGASDVVPAHNVVWLDPRGFASTNRAPVEAQYAVPASAAVPTFAGRPTGTPSAAAAAPAPTAAATRRPERSAELPRPGIMAY